MSRPSEFSRPLFRMVAMMQEAMNREDNLPKSSWLGPDKTIESLREDFRRNLNKLELAIVDGDVEGAWKRAANLGNYAWMIAARVEHDAANNKA